MELEDVGYMPDVIGVYRRLREAERRGKGVRLSADEVRQVWNMDDAIRQAVDAADYMDEHNGQRPPY